MTDSIRILVLEDDPDMRRQLKAVLEDEGYEVETAGHGGEALTLARGRPFDLVVADIRMEGMSGLDVIEKVQNERPEVRTLVITGYSTEADSIRAIQLGVGDYIKKPFRLQDFLASVSRRVTERRQDLARQQRESALRSTALGAMRALVQTQSLTAPLRGAEIGRSLSFQLGLSLDITEDVELSTLIETMKGAGAGAMVEWAAREPGVARLAEGLSEPWEKVGLPTRIVTVALAAAALEREEEEEPASLAVELSLRQPGRFDPGVLEGLDRLRSGVTAAGPDADTGHRRGLLTLGRALEQAGHREAARAAYQELADAGLPSREAVAAWLGLGRLGGPNAVRPPLQKAVEMARAVGPASAGLACLEAGLILMEVRDPAVQPLLEEAVRTLAELRLGAPEAQARLAWARVQNKATETDLAPLALLLRAEHQAELAACVHWLFPWLLEAQGGGPMGEKALARLYDEFPREVARQAENSELSPQARLMLDRLRGQAAPQPTSAAATAPATPRAPTLRIHSLGAFEVFRGDERVDEVDWKTKKVKYLFAYLCAHPGRFVSEDVLIEEFWPGEFEKGRRSLYSATSSLRRCLRPSTWEGDLETILRREGRLQLNPELGTWHDLEELEECLGQVHRTGGGEVDKVLGQARRVAELYRGPYLDGCYMDWALTIRTRLETQVSALLFQLARHCAAQRRVLEALEYVHRVLEVDPCHQEGHLLAMHCFLASNRPEEAVRQFERAQRTLRSELSMEPSIELLEAHQRALLSLSTPSNIK